MNRVSLDSIGIAGFSHDFGTLRGNPSNIEDLFEQFGTKKPSPMFLLVIALGAMIPSLAYLPTGRSSLNAQLHDTMEKIGEELLRRTRDETEGSGAKSEKSQSIIGAVGKFEEPRSSLADAECSTVKAENSGSEIMMSSEEALAQVSRRYRALRDLADCNDVDESTHPCWI